MANPWDMSSILERAAHIDLVRLMSPLECPINIPLFPGVDGGSSPKPSPRHGGRRGAPTGGEEGVEDDGDARGDRGSVPRLQHTRLRRQHSREHWI